MFFLNFNILLDPLEFIGYLINILKKIIIIQSLENINLKVSKSLFSKRTTRNIMQMFMLIKHILENNSYYFPIYIAFLNAISYCPSTIVGKL